MGCKRCGVIGGHDDWCFEESISERDVVIARLESLEEHTAMACHQENVELKEKLAELNRYIESRELGSSSPETALLTAYRDRDAWRQLALDAEAVFKFGSATYYRVDWLDRLRALRGEKT